MYKKISDYGIIGNLHSVALIGRDGSIDWLCLPHIDSPSLFGAILDADDGGFFSITPEGEWDSVLTYLEDSNVLEGKFRTRTGAYTITDFMTVPQDDREGPRQCLLVRLLRVQRGRVRVRVRFEPRFDYGRIVPELKLFPGQGITASGNGEHVALSVRRDLELRDMQAEGLWELQEGERVAIYLRHGVDRPEEMAEEEAERFLLDTLSFWRNWLYRSGPGFFNDLGPHRDPVVRSLLVLKLLYYQPHGTMAAAATTSLPEEIGGVRNWDYRYSWVRDTSMALTALFQVGHVREAQGYLDWLNELIQKSKRNELQVMYRLDGSLDLYEEELSHLEGFRGSRPVRIGNSAAAQKQFSIYGHVMIAAHLLVRRNGKIEAEMWRGLQLMCNFVVNHWHERDWSIWEMRADSRHYVHSKTMCWVTIDKCIRIAEITGSSAELEQWKSTRDEIHRDIMAHGWNEMRQSFVLHYETDALDGSALLMSMSDFIPFNDPRMLATVEALRLDLSEQGFVYRYLTDDGLPGREGTFIACTLWLITNLARQGEIAEAELLLTKVDEVAGPLHLLAEEYDPHWQEQLGNFPQAFSHEAYITAAMAIADAKKEQRQRRPQQEDTILPLETRGKKFAPRPDDLADLLDTVMTCCTKDGRIDYKVLAGSPLANRLGKLLRNLAVFDLNGLATREEKTCFWSNLFNLLVLHSVLTLDIRMSVKEIPWFYRRVGCRVGGDAYTAAVILHGILRGNRPAPGSFIPLLSPGDPRLDRSVRPCDPRVLFAVSTGAASSAPITALHPETLETRLTTAARDFLKRAVVDMERKKLVLPRIFLWYDDFGKSPHDVAVFVAQFLDERAARTIREHPESFVLEYFDYDWRITPREEFAS